MIGKILADRYQITEVRDSGRVLVAEDTHRPGYPLCLIQRLQGAASNPQGFQIAKLILEQRVEAIGRLGKFSQIPAVLTFFELDQGLYLLEEMVMGHPLSQELLAGTPWSEAQTCELMRELLEMLVYMHQHDVILRGFRPDNLIRRQTDGKLVIVNLLLLPPRSRSQGLPNSDPLEISHLYMPPEQLQGNPIFNSNLYSLGMIALQALTGLPPVGLPEIKSHWHDRVNVSPKFRALLDRILANETRDRYRSAKETLKVLQQVSEEEPEESPALFIPTRPHQVPSYRSPQEETVATVDLSSDLSRDLSRDLLTRGLKRSTVHQSEGPDRALADNQSVHSTEVGANSSSSKLVTSDLATSDMATSDMATSDMATSDMATSDMADRPESSHSELNNHHLSRDFAPIPTVLNPKPLSGVILEAQPPQPIAQAGPHLLNGQNSEPSLPTTRIQPQATKPWWRSKRVWGGLGLFVGLSSLLAWHLRLPQTALSAYHLNQGQEKSNRSQYKGAIAQFNEALRWDNQNSGAFFSRGYAFYQVRNFRQSLDDFTQVINLEPASNLAFSALFYRGNLRMSLGDPQGAVRDYNQALEVDSTAALAFVQRGQAENALGKSGNALKSYSQAIRLEPNLAAAYLNRCLTKSNLNDQPGAISDCTEATGINPNLLTAYQNRGLAYHRAGNYKQAIADLNVAIKLDGEDATSYYQRGLIRLDLQDKEGAIGDFNTAIQFKSDHVFAYYQRGLVQEKYGNVDGAIGDLEMAMRLCVEQGMTGCYRDAQYQLKRLGKGDLSRDKPKLNPKNDAIFNERYTPDSNILSP
jgi:tetratricopeptide (TPR) repeat protein